MAKEQIKFYVTEDEKKRLDTLANLRFMTVPNYVKTTALGVQIRQVKEVFVEVEKEVVIEKEVPVPSYRETVIGDKEKDFFYEILNRIDDKGFMRIDVQFNKHLKDMVSNILSKVED